MDAQQRGPDDRVWLAEYPPGVPADIDLSQYTSLADLAEKCMATFADRPAFTCMGGTLSYAELDRLSADFASFLQQRGLQRGDRVALMMPNLLQYPVALLGVLRAGCCVVNINPLYTPREVQHVLRDSAARVIVTVENFCSTLATAAASSSVETVVVTRMGDMLPFPRSALTNFVVKHVRKLVKPWRLDGHWSWRAAVAAGHKQRFRPLPLSGEDAAFLQYTGGTTGGAKAAELTHANMVANVLQIQAWISPVVSAHGRAETILTALPLYHIFALTVNCLTFLSVGAKNVLIPDPRDMAGLVNQLRKQKLTIITGVNTLFNALLHAPGFDRVDFSSLQLAVGGGAAVFESTAAHWARTTGCQLAQGYGLTEASPVVCFTPIDKLGWSDNVGVPLPSTWVALRDDDNRAPAAGEPAELCVKGPQVMRGYWNRPEDTAAAFTADGYLRTGDIATMDERGYFQIVDRKKDMIIVSGFNVYPNEIEAVVSNHPGVLECACVGVPDERSGEAVKIYVVKKDPTLTAEMLQAHCRRELTGYKRPGHIEFLEALPKSNIGKILRKELRDPVAG